MVGADAQLPLPWLAEPLRHALKTQHAHALLVYGASGVGQFELSMTLAQAWLCETADGSAKPCGQCASCRLVQAHSHPDLMVLLPEALQESLGWGPGEGAEAKASKAKPSKELKVEAVRAAVSFAQQTSSRGHAKVVVVYPAERMNHVAANTLLKTLEEPPGITRFVLGCGAPDALLPTIRSRCQAVHLALPDASLALSWLEKQGVAQPQVLLDATGGQPLDALAWSQEGIDAGAWAKLPQQVSAGLIGPLATWPLPRAIDALQKLCHDALLASFGQAPRYFPASALSAGASSAALLVWAKSLDRAARHAEHPWGVGLMVESLVGQGAQALAHGDHSGPEGKRPASLRSRNDSVNWTR